MATTKKAAAPAVTGVAFGSLDMYAAGGGLPEGDYILTDLTVQMFAGFGEVKRTERLGVMVTLKSMTEQNEKPRQQFYSMGSSADKSFAPNPDTGKGIVPVPGGPGATLNTSTNWAIFLKSLYNAGLPQSIFVDDISVLEGTWVHMMNVPEPAERAGFASKTGEDTEERKNTTIAVVSEIKEDGKPWEGTGGVEGPAPAAKTAAKATAAVAKKATPKAAPAPEPEEDAGVDEEDIVAAAINGVGDVLAKFPKGTTRIQLRMATFTSIKASQGGDMAQAVVDKFFSSDEELEGLISQLGYTVKGVQIVPAE